MLIFFSYCRPLGMFGSGGKQNTAESGARGVRIDALAISFREKTQ